MFTKGGGPDGIDEDTYRAASIATLKAIINTLATSSAEFIVAELQRLLGEETVMKHLSAIMPYLYAAGFLSYAGREINAESVTKVLKGAGIEADPEIVDLLFKANVKSHLIYIYSYYFLVALGKLGTASEIADVVRSLGLEAEESRIGDVIAFLTPYESGQ